MRVRQGEVLLHKRGQYVGLYCLVVEAGAVQSRVKFYNGDVVTTNNNDLTAAMDVDNAKGFYMAMQRLNPFAIGY